MCLGRSEAESPDQWMGCKGKRNEPLPEGAQRQSSSVGWLARRGGASPCESSVIESGIPLGANTVKNRRWMSGWIVALSLSLLAGCHRGPQPPKDRWKTSPVTGTVYVDGAPVEGVSVTATPEPGSEIAFPVSTLTNKDGKFAFSTYFSGDGLPEGTYALTFTLLERLPSGGGPDLLKGKYSKVEESNVKFTVQLGKPVDLEPIQLKKK